MFLKVLGLDVLLIFLQSNVNMNPDDNEINMASITAITTM